MALQDKAKELKGKMKAGTGKMLDNKQMQVKGRAEEMQGKLQQKLDETRTHDKHDQPMR